MSVQVANKQTNKQINKDHDGENKRTEMKSDKRVSR